MRKVTGEYTVYVPKAEVEIATRHWGDILPGASSDVVLPDASLYRTSEILQFACQDRSPQCHHRGRNRRSTRCRETSRQPKGHLCEAGKCCFDQRRQSLLCKFNNCVLTRPNIRLQVEPASLETKTLSEPLFATPTKMRGVAVPFDPEVESNVTQAIPMISLL